MKWPESTNLGTTLFRLIHQVETAPLFEDPYASWFFDDDTAQNAFSIHESLERGRTREATFQRIAYTYTILREKFFDDFIESAIQIGYRQLILLGSGFDMRFLRLATLQEHNVRTVEVDTSATLRRKQNTLSAKLGCIPNGWHFCPMDLQAQQLHSGLGSLIDRNLRSICISQGLTYYLPRQTVSNMLDEVAHIFPTGTFIGLDFCTQHMLTTNGVVPGIQSNIERLREIGEPYVFGQSESETTDWLTAKGYRDVVILGQRDIAAKYGSGRDLPQHMWYIATAKTSKGPAF